ncbi:MULTISPECIES: dienelactone hydrolase family protein [unclassified Brevundimonas]|uniref:dienelactone hydrolase family protein n=1 Tax=unclassified Brevundimonas TaxID=2622653 RepID=UPI0025BBB56D|nr:MULTISPECIES: dienelactone hydrolase family protein [unclassified Brevundimonas]
MPSITTPEGLSPDQTTPTRRTLGKMAVGGAAFAAYAPAALSQEATPIITSAEGLEAGEVTYPAPDGFQLPAYMARPKGNGPYPVVIVASEIFGVHEYIRDVCRRLARQGYLAIAPAFFVREADPAPLTDFQQIIAIVNKASYAQVMGDIAASIDWAKSQPYADADRLGITGFCWGGKVVWQACADPSLNFRAGVAWYGRLAPAANATPEQIEAGKPWPIELAAALPVPVIGLYGDQDSGIPNDSVAAMNAALSAADHTDSHITLFEGAQHGFHADYRPMYHPQHAAEGERRMFEHFAKFVKA